MALVRKYLIQPKERADFEALAGRPIWRGQKLQVLLDHVELANCNRELINWQLTDQVYQDQVLQPVITGMPGELLDWRRPLWEEFYLRIRHESSTANAAQIVVRQPDPIRLARPCPARSNQQTTYHRKCRKFR